ncbi:hypothetical protein SERLA73DRAFT_183881 [Serpula lacrymans var. lacrymans S7.3]|uniref:Uncharacterized protein n=2 Tax=Serpula lacrymans var. lacrymans TaxID=341189 RepID=F8Q208_SERL3|nr:uncharacterized protein SERLADRAFT_471281 [Serpula lacrymans var. lacrymans S7.9]EGN97219.1 hypothetical protein SERLA73DRAFT_183881 [Serpula lacrymans var. lacrymans S7.3]EGO22827.1 hypothetical protein SERLADRAFT_471281 [Serpula lacrymans var. lacrymans S7.9]
MSFLSAISCNMTFARASPTPCPTARVVHASMLLIWLVRETIELLPSRATRIYLASGRAMEHVKSMMPGTAICMNLPTASIVSAISAASR